MFGANAQPAAYAPHLAARHRAASALRTKALVDSGPSAPHPYLLIARMRVHASAYRINWHLRFDARLCAARTDLLQARGGSLHRGAADREVSLNWAMYLFLTLAKLRVTAVVPSRVWQLEGAHDTAARDGSGRHCSFRPSCSGTSTWVRLAGRRERIDTRRACRRRTAHLRRYQRRFRFRDRRCVNDLAVDLGATASPN